MKLLKMKIEYFTISLSCFIFSLETKRNSIADFMILLKSFHIFGKSCFYKNHIITKHS